MDDSLYLREYAKVFAWGMVKAEDMEEIRTYYELPLLCERGRGGPHGFVIWSASA